MSSTTTANKRLRTVVIPIAGYGTRMFPASKTVPKALFPMLDKDGLCKPVLQIIIEEALSAMPYDDVRVCIVLSPSQRPLLQSYFTVPDVLDVADPSLGAYIKNAECKQQLERLQFISKRIAFVEQTEQKGFGHAVLCAKEFVGNEPFLVMLGDHVYTTSHANKLTCTQQLVQAYENQQFPDLSQFTSATTLSFCAAKDLHLNGIVKIASLLQHSKDGVYCLDCETTREKPSLEDAKAANLLLNDEQIKALQATDPFLCYFGIDLMSPKVFDVLEQNLKQNKLTKGELQLRDGQCELMQKSNGGMLGVIVQGARHDTGIPPEYCNTFAAMKEHSIFASSK